MSNAKSADVGGGATDREIFPEPMVIVDTTEDEVIDLTGLADTLDYEVLPRPLLGTYLLG